MISLSAFEREVTITYNDEDDYATIYSAHRPTQTKLDKLCKSNPESYKLVKEDEYSKTYHCSKNLISFRTPIKREMSEEQKEAARIRLEKMRESKKNKI